VTLHVTEDIICWADVLHEARCRRCRASDLR
jgi:hypothetical protein